MKILENSGFMYTVENRAFGSRLSLTKKIHWCHLYASFMAGTNLASTNVCGCVSFPCALLSLYSKATFESNLTSLSVQKKTKKNPRSQCHVWISGDRDRMTWVHSDRLAQVSCLKTLPRIGLVCMHAALISGFAWLHVDDFFSFFVNHQLWTKVFLTTNEGGYLLLKIPGYVCTRPQKESSPRNSSTKRPLLTSCLHCLCPAD